MMIKYFFDSYAIIEILLSSESYKKYINCDFITTKLNLFEVYYRILKDSEEMADRFIKIYSQRAVDFDEAVIAEACKFRMNNKTKNFSMADCIGYAVAVKAGVKFLTGDREFKDMPNVEFAK